jgi:hypothetical protein
MKCPEGSQLAGHFASRFIQLPKHCRRIFGQFASRFSFLKQSPRLPILPVSSPLGLSTMLSHRIRAARQGFEMGVPVAVLNQLFDLGLAQVADPTPDMEVSTRLQG